jgi:hypothetical protein
VARAPSERNQNKTLLPPKGMSKGVGRLHLYHFSLERMKKGDALVNHG